MEIPSLTVEETPEVLNTTQPKIYPTQNKVPETHVSTHFMHEGYFLTCNMHETLFPCLNHDWFVHREIAYACFEEIGIIYVYDMHVTRIHASNMLLST